MVDYNKNSGNSESGQIDKWMARYGARRRNKNKENDEQKVINSIELTDWNEVFKKSEIFQKAESLGYKIERFNIHSEDELKRALDELEKTMASTSYDENSSEVVENKPENSSEFAENEPENSSEIVENKPENGSEIVENKPENGSEIVENKPENGSEIAENEPENSGEIAENDPENGSEIVENEPENSSEIVENEPENSDNHNTIVIEGNEQEEATENNLYNLWIEEKRTFYTQFAADTDNKLVNDPEKDDQDKTFSCSLEKDGKSLGSITYTSPTSAQVSKDSDLVMYQGLVKNAVQNNLTITFGNSLDDKQKALLLAAVVMENGKYADGSSIEMVNKPNIDINASYFQELPDNVQETVKNYIISERMQHARDKVGNRGHNQSQQSVSSVNQEQNNITNYSRQNGGRE